MPNQDVASPMSEQKVIDLMSPEGRELALDASVRLGGMECPLPYLA